MFLLTVCWEAPRCVDLCNLPGCARCLVFDATLRAADAVFEFRGVENSWQLPARTNVVSVPRTLSNKWTFDFGCWPVRHVPLHEHNVFAVACPFESWHSPNVLNNCLIRWFKLMSEGSSYPKTKLKTTFNCAFKNWLQCVWSHVVCGSSGAAKVNNDELSSLVLKIALPFQWLYLNKPVFPRICCHPHHSPGHALPFKAFRT